MASTEESANSEAFRGLRKSGFRNSEWKKNPAPANRLDSMFLSETCSGREFREFDSIFFHRTEFRPFFSSAEWFRKEFWKFSVPRNGSEWNSESLLLFLFHGTEFWVFFSSEERFITEFREFSVPQNSRNSARTNQLFRLLRLMRNNFFVGICQP